MSELERYPYQVLCHASDRPESSNSFYHASLLVANKVSDHGYSIGIDRGLSYFSAYRRPIV